MRLRLISSRIPVRDAAQWLFAAAGRCAPNARIAARRYAAAAAAITAAITASLLLAAGAAAAAEVPAHVVKDPYYGDSLFYFYQARFFTSVTNLMVSQQFERMPHHADEAEVLRGGLFLSYGMHREAGEIFTRLIAKGAPPPIRDRAWFYLAKIRYQRGLFAEAEEAIGRVERGLPPDLDEERWMLMAQLLMARGDYARAAGILNVIAIGPGARLYARYNLGVALIKSGEVARGTAELDDIGQQSFASEEFRSLRDKANVALGFSALQENNAEMARSYLERVRLSGMLSNKALLGFGWAADSLKQPNKALVPWTELAQRDASDAAVLEAKLAVPYALAELGAYAQSLDKYNDAIDAFDRESAKLDESVAAIRAGKLLDGLLARNPGDEMGWFWNITDLPQMPHGAHLAAVLAQNDFQEAFKNYRDLKFLGSNLDRWESSLAVLGDMLANRRQAFTERLPRVRATELALGIDRFVARRDVLANELARVEAQVDGMALADDKERDLAVRLNRVRDLLAHSGTAPEIVAARERYRRVAGAMTWQVTREFPARLWDAKKDLKQLDASLAETRLRDTGVGQAQLEEPARFERFAARIAELDRRLHALLPRVASLTEEQRNVIQELAVAELERQKERLQVYKTTARFAVAQIYDRATLGKDPGRATQ